MKKPILFVREKLDENSYRVPVMGGWMVVIENQKLNAMTSMFVADRMHQWKVVAPQKVVPLDVHQGDNVPECLL